MNVYQLKLRDGWPSARDGPMALGEPGPACRDKHEPDDIKPAFGVGDP
jgi:hypothetical protein